MSRTLGYGSKSLHLVRRSKCSNLCWGAIPGHNQNHHNAEQFQKSHRYMAFKFDFNIGGLINIGFSRKTIFPKTTKVFGTSQGGRMVKEDRFLWPSNPLYSSLVLKTTVPLGLPG